MKAPNDPRGLLRQAITNREAACRHRDEAAAALARADGVRAATTTESEKASASLATAEAEHARVIAKTIRAGGKPNMELSAEAKTAQATLAEVASRSRMATAARDQIAEELKQADAELTETTRAVERAATAVVVGEVEAEAADLETLLRRLCAMDALVFGSAWLRLDGKAITLSPKVRAVVERLLPVRQAIAQLRPAQPILALPPEQAEADRCERYRQALTANATATLADVKPPPPLKPMPTPSHKKLQEDAATAHRERINKLVAEGHAAIISSS